MGTFVMAKAECPDCGALNGVELLRKKEPIACFYVKCKNCGRESAKHVKPEDAIRDWNHLEGSYGDDEKADEGD